MLLLFAALILCVAAVAWHGARERGRQLGRARVAATNAAVAERLGPEIADEEVRRAWEVICDALAQGWLSSGRDVAEMAARLRRGIGTQLMEEAAVDLDDEAPAPDRVLLYHVGLVPARRTCPRDALVRELERLAAALA